VRKTRRRKERTGEEVIEVEGREREREGKKRKRIIMRVRSNNE
jgi:hypothetical protein